MPTKDVKLFIPEGEDMNRVEFFMSPEYQICISSESGDFFTSISRKDWEVVKIFIDEQFKAHE